MVELIESKSYSDNKLSERKYQTKSNVGILKWQSDQPEERR
jgi:hypothetical protein